MFNNRIVLLIISLILSFCVTSTKVYAVDSSPQSDGTYIPFSIYTEQATKNMEKLAPLPRKYYNVKNTEELFAALADEQTSFRKVISLVSDVYEINDQTGNIKVGSDTELLGNGAVINAKNLKVAIELNGECLNQQYVGNNIEVPPLAGPPFIVAVPDTHIYKANQIIEIRDKRSSEINVISAVNHKNNSIELQYRPLNKYEGVSAEISIISPAENSKIENIAVHYSYNGVVDEKERVAVINCELARGISIDNLSIFNMSGPATSLSISRSYRTSVSNCNINCGGNGISLMTGAEYSRITNNSINNAINAILIRSNNNIISNNTITRSGAFAGVGDGINISQTASDNIISNNSILGSNCYGIWVTQGEQRNNSIVSNTIEAGVTLGICIDTGEGCLIQGNILRRNSGGIGIGNVKNVIIANNIIDENSKYGIMLYANKNKTIVSGNILTNNGYELEEMVDISVYKDYNHVFSNNLMQTKIHLW